MASTLTRLLYHNVFSTSNRQPVITEPIRPPPPKGKSYAAAIGAVYLRREKGKPVEALNVACPHAGCFVDYVAARHGYLCPCHNSTFALDGKINDPKSPSPRALDTLEVEIRGEGEIWVRFQNYRAGVSTKVPA